MLIRNATIDDLDEICALELTCFSHDEAAKREDFKERLDYYPNHFWLLFEDGKLVSFVDGFCTDENDLTDDMYEDAGLHDENGDWQMIFGVVTHPDFRNRGYASRLVNELIGNSKSQNRSGVVLTCKDHLIEFYSKFGFVDEGLSEKSHHAGEDWNQMRLIFSLKKEK